MEQVADIAKKFNVDEFSLNSMLTYVVLVASKNMDVFQSDPMVFIERAVVEWRDQSVAFLSQLAYGTDEKSNKMRDHLMTEVYATIRGE